MEGGGESTDVLRAAAAAAAGGLRLGGLGVSSIMRSSVVAVDGVTSDVVMGTAGTVGCAATGGDWMLCESDCNRPRAKLLSM